MIDGKTVVGIVPWCTLWEDENQYEDKYLFVETYGRRVLDAGMIPLAVLPVDGLIRTPVPEMCDAFVLTGGRGIGPYHMQVIEHAIRQNKKLLGICLGCQALHMYFRLKAELRETGADTEIGEYCKQKMLAGKNTAFCVPVEGHRFPLLPRGDKSGVKHPVRLVKDSAIARILGTEEVQGASYHSWCIGEPAPELRVSAWSPDGIVEGVEYNDRIIGTQFHPDVDNELLALFTYLKS